jgi:hypothetical protein
MIQKKVCMVGTSGVGKTSLVAKFVHSMFSDKYLTTVGVKMASRSAQYWRCSRPALSGRLMLRHGDRAPWLQRESVETVLRCSRPR